MAEIQRGQWVRLKAYGGEITRRVVGKTESSVIVCTDEEYETAAKEKREPKAVGFSKASLLNEAWSADLTER